jgi:hypothetical protein
MSVHLPSLDVLESNDDERLGEELQLARLRSQVAVVRTIADEVEHLARPRDANGLKAQLAEEMARLGCRLLETAASLTEPARSEGSGIFARQPAFPVADSRPAAPRTTKESSVPTTKKTMQVAGPGAEFALVEKPIPEPWTS